MERVEDNNKKGSFVGTGIICGIVGAVAGAIGLYVWQKSEENRQLQYENQRAEKVYNKHGDCPICLGKMDELTILPCGHQYHASCISQAKSSKAVCPVCRKEF